VFIDGKAVGDYASQPVGGRDLAGQRAPNRNSAVTFSRQIFEALQLIPR